MAAPAMISARGLLRCSSTVLRRFHTLRAPFACKNKWANIESYRNVTGVGLPEVSRSLWTRAVVVGRCHRLSTSATLLYSNGAEPASQSEAEDYHSIIKDTEKGQGPEARLEFQAETRMLLDIVAKSLYSEKEVFIRELISNCSDALEKRRYLDLTSDPNKTEGQHLQGPPTHPLEIHIATDKLNRTFTIQDTGIGMTREEMIDSLGTIARSGSKAFLEELKTKNDGGDVGSRGSIIGQFGVGFYSTFMVAEQVDVYSRAKGQDTGHKWTSDGSGTYTLSQAEGVEEGTKIVLKLKGESGHFADEDAIREVIKKYSNFVGSPIYLNGKKANTLQALWLMDPRQVSPEQHDEFYRFVGNTCDSPRYRLHYQTDVPLSIRCLLYVPEGKPGLFEMNPGVETGVALYSRKVLIKNKAENVLPKWLRFVKGVVDSEDIPLNLSRELLQDSALIRKIRTVLTNRLIRHLYDQMQKDFESYDNFFKNYGLFVKEGILSSNEQTEKEEISKLLRFESSTKVPGDKVTLAEYCSRMKDDQRDIYYLAAPSRELAESSPYYEAVKDKDVEVLFCFEPYDELVLLQLQQFNRKNLTSVEKEMRREKEADPLENLGEGGMTKEEASSLITWMKNSLGFKVHKVKATQRLLQHPCLVSVEEMAAARHYVRTSLQQMSEEQRFKLLEPTLEINLSHPIIKKLCSLKDGDSQLAELITNQLFDNAMVAAGLVEDPRKVTATLTDLLTKLLEKH